MKQEVLYVKDMAKFMGKTEASIRSFITRRAWDAIPKPIRLGGRIAWYRPEVEEWFREKQFERLPEKPKKRGRPRKKRSSF